MSGAAGGTRIPRAAVDQTVKDFVNNILSKIPGFKSAKISGSYNQPVKQDFGDIDLVVSIETDQPKKEVKKMIVDYFEGLSDKELPYLNAEKHKGKKAINHGEIISNLYPISGMPGEFVQIDNIIAVSESEGDFKKVVLDYPAEIQGLILGLVKTPLLEEDPEQVFKRMGIKDVPSLGPNQEYEFHVDTTGLSLKIVTLDENYRQLDSNIVWESTDWNDVKKLLKDFNLEGTFKDFTEKIKTFKNPRSKNRVKGFFKASIKVGAAEKGTPKGDSKQQALDTVAALEEKYGSLVMGLIKPLLLEQEAETIAIFPGKFKPPHKDHLARIQAAAKMADQVRVIIGPNPVAKNDEAAISAQEALAIFDLYKKKNLVPDNVTFEISDLPSPVLKAYKEFENNPEQKYIAVFGKDDAARFKGLAKMPNVTINNFPEANIGDASATDLRKAIAARDIAAIKQFLPFGVSPSEYLDALNMPEKEPVQEASQAKIPYLPLSKREVETLNSEGKVTRTFAGTGFSHKVDPKIVNTYLNAAEVTYTDWNTGQRVKAPVDVEYLKQVGSISITVYSEKSINKAQEEEPIQETYKGKRTNDGAPGTLKAKISKLYGGDVTITKAKKLKNRENATPHDKRQANWFINFHSKNEAADPQAGTAAPYGSGFAPIKEKYEFKVSDKVYDTEDNSLITVEYTFTTPDNTYRVEFHSGEYSPESKTFNVSFGLDKQGSKLDTFQMTGEGNALSILKTIVDIIIDFTNRFEANKLVINPTSEKRGKIYSMVLKSLPSDILNKVELVKEAALHDSGYKTLEEELAPMIVDLTKHMYKQGLSIDPAPAIEFVEDEDNAKNPLGKTAYYDPNNKLIVLYTTGRHPKDILRSFAHEMIHHCQNMEGRLGDITTTNVNEDDYLRELEREAYERGNMSFRSWENSLRGDNGVRYIKGFSPGDHNDEPIMAEGKYDSLSNKLSGTIFRKWKEDYEAGNANSHFEQYIVDEKTGLEFDLTADAEFVDEDIYSVDGGANAGNEDEDAFIHANFKIDIQQLPKLWEKIAFDLKDFMRHEIEHLTQQGTNLIGSKKRNSDQARREKIKAGELPTSKYPTLRSEIEPMLQGMYFSAKKQRRPFIDVINDWFNSRGFNDQEKKEILKIWKPYLKQLSLPNL